MKQYNSILCEKIKCIESQSASHWLEQMLIDSISSDTINVSFPNNFIASFVQQNISNVVYDLLVDVLEQKDFTINYITRDLVNSVEEEIEDPSFVKVDTVVKKHRVKRSGLNSKYTFDRYITGNHNEMPVSISKLIVEDLENTSECYNPFLIQSNTGLGKTHLVQSVYHELVKKHVKVTYLTSERFVEMFLSSQKNGDKKSFISKFKDFQVIIIDDIQFFEDKPASQDMLKKIFLNIVNNKKNIILTMDRPVEKLNILADGLLDDLSKGLSLEIT